MNKSDKDMVVGATLLVVGAGLFVANVILIRKETAKQKKLAAEAKRAEVTEVINNLADAFDTLITNIRFNDLVAKEFPEE